MPKVGVVISMLEKHDLTRKCIDSVITHAGIDCDIVVIDDGSIVPYKDDRVKIVRFDKPHGNTHSMNEGIKFFDNKYDYIVNLDNDVILTHNAFKYLVDVMEANPILALVGSARLRKIDGRMILIGQGIDLIGRAEEVEMSKDDTDACIWLSGCSVMLRSSVIREIGMYDKRFKNYCQDAEWCLRAILNDYRSAVVHMSRVYHLGSGTIEKTGNTLIDDRNVLLKIVSCDRTQEILRVLPLDHKLNQWGKLTFNMFNKPKENHVKP